MSDFSHEESTFVIHKARAPPIIGHLLTDRLQGCIADKKFRHL